MNIKILIALLFITCNVFAGNIYVANSGNDVTGDGSISLPYQTIAKAVSVMTSADDIFLQAGSTFAEEITLTLSGTISDTIHFKRYGEGANPIITGAIPLTGWTQDTSLSGRHYASFAFPVYPSDEFRMNRLTINGVDQSFGRWPKENLPASFGCIYPDNVYDSAGLKVVISTQLQGNHAGGEVFIREQRWIGGYQKVKADGYNRFVTTSAILGRGFFFMNKPQYCTEYGEYAYDSIAGRVYLFTGATDPSTLTIAVSNKGSNFRLDGADYVSFDSITFTMANGVALHLFNSANNISLTNSTISDSRYGIFAEYGSNKLYVNKNVITDLTGVGIYLYGASKATLTQNTLTNIAVKPTHMIYGDGQNTAIQFSRYHGPWFDQATADANDSCMVNYNTIDSVSYQGISFDGDNTQVKYNVISRYCQNLDDGAAIYTYNGQLNTPLRRKSVSLVEGNVLNGYSSRGPGPGINSTHREAMGIYIDDGGNNVSIKKNIAYDDNYAGIFLHNAERIYVDSNFLFNNYKSFWALYDGKLPQAVFDSVHIKRNMFIAKDSSQHNFHYFSIPHALRSTDPPTDLLIDSNYYSVLRGNRDGVFDLNFAVNENRRSLSYWQTTYGHDLNSSHGAFNTTNLSIPIIFKLNVTNQVQVSPLDASSVDVITGAAFTEVSLQPYSGKVLAQTVYSNTTPTRLNIKWSVVANAPPIEPPTVNDTSFNKGEFYGSFASYTTLVAPTNGTSASSAIQAALDTLGADGKNNVLYVPNGTYSITTPLLLKWKIGISIVGQNPDSVIFIWNGTAGANRMIYINGVAYSKLFNRMTFNGQNNVRALIDQSWDNNSVDGFFDTGNEYADSKFMNAKYGIYGGHLGFGFAETVIARCVFTGFVGNDFTGDHDPEGSAITLGNFNALDCWIWDSKFENNKHAISNNFGAGGFKVYRSIFKNNEVDARMYNSEGFAFRENYSSGSGYFIKTNGSDNAMPVIIQDNVIVDWTSEYAVTLENHGPFTLMDNVFRGANKAFYMGSPPSSAAYLYNNTFTRSDYMFNQTAFPNRVEEYNSTVVTQASLSGIQERTFVGFQPYVVRQKFEVPAGSSAATIQAAIDAADALTVKGIVHLQRGIYNINTTLNPKGAIIIGDGHDDRSRGTALTWTGAANGTIFKGEAIYKPVIGEMHLHGGNTGNGIVFTKADSVNQVYGHQIELRRSNAQLISTSLLKANVIITNAGFAYGGVSGRAAVEVTGATGSTSKTIIYAANGAADSLQMNVMNGGVLVNKDYWKEVTHLAPYINATSSTNGRITIDGSRINVLRGSTGNLDTAYKDITINGATLSLTTIGSKMDDAVRIKGDGTNVKFLGLGNFMVQSPYLYNTSTADARVLLSRKALIGNQSVELTDIGLYNASFVTTMLADARAVKVPRRETKQVALNRIWVANCIQGIEVKSGL